LENAAQSETLASQVDDAAGVVIVPAFTGLGAPYWDDQTRGTILGLTRGTNRSHIARAALEAMAHQSADLVQAMENDTGIEIGTLLVDGGAVANNLLLQIQADLLQKPVCRPKRLESTALGAARMAGLAVGYWTMDDFVQEPEREFVPHMKEEDQTEARKTWASAVKAARSYEH
jgi:glycerol kinase